MSGLPPRVVIVHRRTEFTALLARHGTRGQAAFFLASRGRDLAEVEARHDRVEAALAQVGAALPADWRVGRVERADLDRFLFAPEDRIVVVGQDGLVANVAKYLADQPVIGVNADPDANPGVLVPHRPADVARLLAGEASVAPLTMVEAVADDGQSLLALNEIYLGHPSHQTSRWTLHVGGAAERQASSGLIVGTGTGATGWCASVARSRADAPVLPAPTASELAWFVREAWPSPATGTDRVQGLLGPGDRLDVAVETDGLVAFGDGMEGDRLTLAWGQRVSIGIAERRLCLVL